MYNYTALFFPDPPLFFFLLQRYYHITNRLFPFLFWRPEISQSGTQSRSVTRDRGHIMPERQRESCVSQATWYLPWRWWSARTVYNRSRHSRRWLAHWRRPPWRQRRSRQRMQPVPRTAPPRYHRRDTGSWPRLTPVPVTCPLWLSRPTRIYTPTAPATPIEKPAPTTPATRPATPSDLKKDRSPPPGRTFSSLQWATTRSLWTHIKWMFDDNAWNRGEICLD